MNKIHLVLLHKEPCCYLWHPFCRSQTLKKGSLLLRIRKDHWQIQGRSISYGFLTFLWESVGFLVKPDPFFQVPDLEKGGQKGSRIVVWGANLKGFHSKFASNVYFWERTSPYHPTDPSKSSYMGSYYSIRSNLEVYIVFYFLP